MRSVLFLFLVAAMFLAFPSYSTARQDEQETSALSSGSGARSKDAEFVERIRKAAEQGYAFAQFSLGSMYHHGDGVNQDYSKAAEWYRMAAEQGDTGGQINLGMMYLQGTGVIQDSSQAYFWLSLSVGALNGQEREEIERLLKTVSGKMTAEQIADAQRIVKAWKPKVSDQGRPPLFSPAPIAKQASPTSARVQIVKVPPVPIINPVPAKTRIPIVAGAGNPVTWGKWGVALWPTEFKATPGVSLRFHLQNDDGLQYALMAEGFPEDKTYFLWQKTLASGQPTRTPIELSIRKKAAADGFGFVVKRADGGTVLMKPDGFAEGEALQVALISEDKTIVALAKTIPNPIESVRDPYRIWVELATANSSGFIIWGEGFEPNEEMNTTSISEGETVMSKVRANVEGRFMTMIFPAVVGRQSGLASYSVAGKAGEVKVHYRWGQPDGQRITKKDEAGDMPQVDTDFKALFDDANLNFRQRKYEQAIKLYKKANKLKENKSLECLWGLAQSYDGLGAYKNVQKTCEWLIEACGDNPQYRAMAWNLIGNTLSNNAMKNPDKPDMKKLREAEQAYRKVLLASPGLQTAHYNLGVVLIRMDRVSEGIEELRASLSSKGDTQLTEKARKTMEDPRRAIYDFAPDFSMVTSDGEYISSEELRGKVILLDFWGAWCSPCRNAIPDMKRLAKKYSDKEFKLVSIDVNDPEEEWLEFLEENKMEWTQVRDDKSLLQRTFQVSAFPTYILIDHDGIIRTRIMGGGSQNHSRVSDEIRKALKNLEKTAAVSLQQK